MPLHRLYPKARLRGTSAPFVILAATTLIYLGPQLIKPDLLLNRNNDLQEFFWPLIHFIKETIISQRQLPLWNPLWLSGTPLVTDPQVPYFYPFNVIFLFLPIQLAFSISIFLHVFAAGVGMYLLSNSGFGFSKRTSVLLGLLYLSAPRMASYLEAGHIGLVQTWAWVPFSFLLIHRVLTKPKVRDIVFASFTLSALYISHLLVFVYTSLAVFAYCLYIILQKRHCVRRLPALMLIGILTVGLCAVAILPQLNWQPHTTRSLLLATRETHPQWHGVVEFVAAALNPQILGISADQLNTEKFISIGLLLSTLAVFGFMNLTGRLKFVLALSIGSIGLFASNNVSPIGSFLLSQDWFVLNRVATRPWFLMIIIVLFLAGKALERVKNQKIFILLVVLLLAEYNALSGSIINRNPPDSSRLAPAEVYDFIAQEPGIYRVYCTTRCLSQKTAAEYGLQLVEGYATLQQTNYYKHAWGLTGAYWDHYTLAIPPMGITKHETAQPSAVALGDYNTLFVISPYPLSDQEFKPETVLNGFTVYRNHAYKPRASIPVVNWSPNRIELRSDKELTEITLAEVASPGWQVTTKSGGGIVSETPSSLRKVNLYSPATEATLTYKPPGFRAGFMITTLSLGIAFGGLLYDRQKKK